MWESLVELDYALFKYINSSWIGQFEQFWIFVTSIESWIPLYLLFFYLLFKKLAKPLKYIAIAGVPSLAAFTLLLTNLVKNYIQRLRPNNDPVLVDVINIIQKPLNFSFWSGHTAVSLAVTLFVLLLLRRHAPSKWYALFFLWPLLFALSRVINGVHFPSDIFVGALVGAILGIGAYKMALYINRRLLLYTT